MSLLSRALFRIKMRGGGMPGLAYLLRHTFSPTEEDWLADSNSEKQNALGAIERPLRLARKYGRSRDNESKGWRQNLRQKNKR